MSVSWQPLPLLKVVHANGLAVLLQPAGSAARLLVSCRCGGEAAVIGREHDGDGWLPMPTTALIWPDGDGVAATLSFVVAAYGQLSVPVCAHAGIVVVSVIQSQRAVVERGRRIGQAQLTAIARAHAGALEAARRAAPPGRQSAPERSSRPDWRPACRRRCESDRHRLAAGLLDRRDLSGRRGGVRRRCRRTWSSTEYSSCRCGSRPMSSVYA